MNINQMQSNQKLIIQLYKDNITENTISEPKYDTLNNFRKTVERRLNEPHHKPYESMLKKAFIYRIIFTFLGALFFFFGIFIFEQSINWLPYSYIFSNSLTAKNIAFSICLLFSTTAFGMTFIISAEREALQELIKRSKKKLLKIYNKQNFQIDLQSDSSLRHKSEKLNHLYESALEKVERIKIESKNLLSKIAKSELSGQKEMIQLYNEALLESNDQLHTVINHFQKATFFF